MALWHYFFKLKVHCTLGCSYVLLFGFLSICININVRVRNLIKICKYSIEEVTFSCTLIHKRSLQQVAPIGNVIAPSLKVLVNYTRVACQMDVSETSSTHYWHHNLCNFLHWTFTPTSYSYWPGVWSWESAICFSPGFIFALYIALSDTFTVITNDGFQRLSQNVCC